MSDDLPALCAWIVDLEEKGVRLEAGGDGLRVAAGAGLLDQAAIGRLRANKRAIAELLAEPAPQAAQAEAPAALPLTPVQRTFWFLAAADRRHRAHAVVLTLALDGPWRAEAVEAALTELARRHGALRVRLATAEDGMPLQLLDREDGVVIGRHDARGAMADALDFCARRAAEPFDLEGGPLWRADLVAVDDRHAILQIVLHHIIADGTATDLLARDLAAAYARAAGAGDAAPPSPPADYAGAVAAGLARGDGAGRLAIERWARFLAGAPAETALPADRPRHTVSEPASGPAVATVRRHLPAEVAAGVAAMAKAGRTTAFSVIATAFAVLVHRHGGQTDMVLGIVDDGRRDAASAAVCGVFADVVPLRAEVVPGEGFGSHLAGMHRRLLQARARGAAPFTDIVRTAGHSGAGRVRPLVQIALNMPPHADRSPLPAGPVVFRRLLDLHDAPLQFDLELLIRPDADGYALVWRHDPALYDRATVEAFHDRFETLLRSAAADPDLPVGDLALLSDAERRSIGKACRGPELPVAASLVELVEAAARAAPDAAVLSDGRETVGRAEFLRRARTVAGRLHGAGVGRGDRVALLAPRSIDALAGLFGILAAGAVYVPVDPGLPPRRIDAMIAQALPAAILAPAGLAERAGTIAGGRPVVSLDGLADADGGGAVPAAVPTPVPTIVPPGAGDPAFILFTSGSTGVPKGVAGTHGAVCNRVAWACRAQGLRKDHVVALKTTVSFVDSLAEIFLALGGPASGYLIPDAVVRDGVRFIEALAEGGVTHAILVPSHLQALLSAFPDLGGRLPALEAVTTSGEALTSEVLRLFRAALPGARLHNVYGLTEAFDATGFEATGWGMDRPLVPIGRPLPNIRVYPLDARRRLVPFGVVGEMAVAGPGIARGYFGNDALTAERFVTPADPLPDGRVFLTGDLVRLLPDGRVDFVGRGDGQIKIRGMRVDPQEVAAVLAGLPPIAEACVRGIAGGEAGAGAGAGGRLRLVAWIVPAAGRPAPDPAALASDLSATLPAHMLPEAYVVLDALPRLANGKIDAAALPAPQAALPDAPEAAAWSGDEGLSLACTLWADALKVAAIDPDADFFAAGGHSLLAITLVAAVNAAFGADLGVADLFEAPTPRRLMARIGAARRDGAPPPRLVRSGERPDYPLSPFQRHNWDVSKRGNANLLVFVRTFEGSLDTGRLARAAAAVAARHDMLRASFHEEGGRVFQRIAATVPVDLRLVHPPAGTGDEAAVHALVAEEAARLFDPGTPGLFRVRVIPSGAGRHIVVFLFHHLIFDAVSFEIFLDDLHSAYLADGAPATPAPAMRYVDVAVASAEGEAAARHAAALVADWRARLAPPPSGLDLGADPDFVAGVQAEMGVIHRVLDADCVGALREASKRERVSPFMMIEAAFLVLLAARSGAEEAVTTWVSANRGAPETVRMIGSFSVVQPLRIDLAGDPALGTLLARIREATLWAQTRPLALTDLVGAVEPAGVAREVLMQARINMLPEGRPEMRWTGDLVCRRPELALRVSTDSELYPHFRARGDEIDLYFRYAPKAFGEAAAAGLCDALAAAVDLVARRPAATPLSALLREVACHPRAGGAGIFMLDGGPVQ